MTLVKKYVGKEHADHLIKCLKEKYTLTEDWTSCGITLDWNYAARTLDISMPGYIKKKIGKIQAYNVTYSTLSVLA
jgi:hypothetical protein